jgi:hypothetical protein
MAIVVGTWAWGPLTTLEAKCASLRLTGACAQSISKCVHVAGAHEKCPRPAAAGASMAASTIALVVVVVVVL